MTTFAVLNQEQTLECADIKGHNEIKKLTNESLNVAKKYGEKF